MKKAALILGYILLIILFFGVITVLTFGSGEMQAFYNRTTGSHVSSSETDMFHESKGYVDGMVQDLSRNKLELTQTKDPVARTAIIQHINQEFANFNINDINNLDLQQFLRDVRNGNIQ